MSGRVIAFMGIPGSGKSSVARELADLAGGKIYSEPEEHEWSPCVASRATTGYFTAISWFRSVRVPQLFNADSDRTSGRIAVVDSYYDKLFVHYMAHPAMSWLLPSDDPYFDVLHSMAKLDSASLPNADALVFLAVDESTWRGFIAGRDREMDAETEFRTVFDAQRAFLSAAQSWSAATNARLIEYQQQRSGPRIAATELLQLLQTAGILSQ